MAHHSTCACAGRREKIAINNVKGRLSEGDIERMVKEAENFAEQARLLSLEPREMPSNPDF